MKEHKQHFCVFGRKAVLDAFKAGKRFDKILLLKSAAGEDVTEIYKLAKETETPTQNVPKEKLEAVAKKYSKHRDADLQGVIGFLSIIDYYKIDDVLDSVYAKGETPLFLVLDGVTDVGNFGAIARSAECFGAHAIIVPTQGSAQINAEAMKASVGALGKIMVCREKSLLEAVEFLKTNGIRIYGTEMKESSEISKADFKVPCAIVMGSEGYGISKPILKACDERVRIPMKGKTESLNVSVSTGIVLYEARNQRFS
ncbi:MAG TPA: 23S rRNA (guanosine(2251)-2'-O)-methyltransferase RlmB [Chitinophagales bacterium]|nr:23S rRNA (guanosine(2251)-2'-O)-methyltransferase RlmB [Chitinophagales bacterium]HLP50763.1 23S rRNA (guanosine(2251)-2'-O)-methyltransferase RlmB [Chitinophagales bacterium]